MSVELIKRQLDINECVMTENVQIVKERDMIVPDGNPDMLRVLYADGEIHMEQIDVQEGRIVYKGHVEVTILYMPENSGGIIYHMVGAVPLEDFMIMEGISKEHKVDFCYEIEHIHWNILNERKVNVKAVISLGAEVTRSGQADVTTDLQTKEFIQVREVDVQIVQPSSVKEERVIVKDELTIMQGKSSIGEILRMDTKIKEDQVKRTESELLFNGMIELNTLYKAQDNEERLETVTHRIPFSGSSDLPKTEEEVDWMCELDVKPTYIQVSPDYDGEDRIIEVECIVTAKYNTFDKVVVKTIEDVYCPGKKVEVKSNSQNYMNLKARPYCSVPRKEVIDLEGTNPDRNQIFRVCIRPILQDKCIKNNKVVLDGMNEVSVVYTNNEGANKIETATVVLPFHQEMEVMNVGGKVFIRPHIDAKDVKVISQNKDNMVVEYLLEASAEVYEEAILPIIEEVNLLEMTKEELAQYPSITVYVIKKGDSLWSIAKRYNTTVADIAEINGIDPHATIFPGQKLIIVKKK
jgi:LysM repeat protein